VDSVGGDTLAAIVRGLAANGSVAACGVAGGSALNTTVFPFILRGVNLLGVNSVYVSQSDRQLMWERLTRDLPLPLLDSMTQEAPLEAVFELGEKIIGGGVRGRTVIKIS
jgi:acrylyl-CoA reductase (NADPH)